MPTPAGLFNDTPEEFIDRKFSPQNELSALGMLADFTPVVGDAKAAYEGVEAAKEGDWIGAGIAALSVIPIVGDSLRGAVKGTVKGFTKEAVEKAVKQSGRKSRSIVTEMNIDDFLEMAAKGERDDSTKFLKDKTEFTSIPELWVETTGGVAKVTGHEGRHRARRLKEMGYETMPVMMTDRNIRWDQAANPDSFDYVKDFPTKLTSQEGDAVMDFPVKQGESVFSPYFRNEAKDEVKEEVVNVLDNPMLQDGYLENLIKEFEK